MKAEKQKVILGLIKSGDYFADDRGVVFSNHGAHGPTILGQRVNNSGYYLVTLNKIPKRIDCSTHQFCFLFFKGAFKQSLQINHIDGNKLNNAINNLNLVTPSENQKHSVRLGTFRKQDGELNASAKLKKKDVLNIRKKHAQGSTQVKLAQEFGVTRGNINSIVLRKTWKGL